MEKLTIKQAREQSGIMQKNMPQCIGVTPSKYFHYERGNYMPADVLEKFALAVDIPIMQIKCREPMQSPWRGMSIKC